MARLKPTIIEPVVAFGASMPLLVASSGKWRRAKLGNAQLGDVQATAKASVARSQERLARIDELCRKHGSASLILEASLTPAELTDLFAVATGSSACLFGGGEEITVR